MNKNEPLQSIKGGSVSKKPYVPKQFPPDNINWEGLVALIRRSKQRDSSF